VLPLSCCPVTNTIMLFIMTALADITPCACHHQMSTCQQLSRLRMSGDPLTSPDSVASATWLPWCTGSPGVLAGVGKTVTFPCYHRSTRG